MKLSHRQQRMIFRTLFYTSVSLHFVLVFTNLIAFMVLPFTYSWFDVPFWLFVLLVTPIETFIFRLVFVAGECPITNCENLLRETLGMKTISSFVGHYLVKPFRRKRID